MTLLRNAIEAQNQDVNKIQIFFFTFTKYLHGDKNFFFLQNNEDIFFVLISFFFIKGFGLDLEKNKSSQARFGKD